MLLVHKLRRYRSLISQFTNWPGYLSFKGGKAPAFKFRMRNGFEIEVQRKMLPPFKESFFDQVYLKGYPESFKMPEEPVIVDIGANVGFFGLFIFSQYPSARVFGFEPMPFNYKQLNQYQDTYPQFAWKNYNEAVSENRNGLTLFSSTIDQFSTMAGVFATDGRGEKIEVKTLTLVDVMDQNELSHIDLLKLDCEGSEYSILYNLSDEQLSKVTNLSIETHPGGSDSESHDALKSYLVEKGFALTDKMNDDGTGYIWAWVA